MELDTQVIPRPQLMRIPQWQCYPWLRAGFSSRFGGRSGVHGQGELNLGWTTGDDPAAVAQNRAAFVAEVSAGAEMSLITLQQVHSGVVRDLEQEAPPWMSADGKATREGDGLISRTPGRLLAILTADCVPVLVADTRTHATGAFHAGWRGTLAHIAQNGVEAMRTLYGSRPEDLIAAIGPCIQACCFEVGPEVQAHFEERSQDAATLFSVTPEGQLHMDLMAANRRQLLAAGLAPEQIKVIGECTACTRLPDGRRKYFSYRSERGNTGRMLSAIGAVE